MMTGTDKPMRDMKTIRERAKEWSGFVDCHSGLKEVCLHNGYIKGATEQRAIDIENATIWIITTYLGDYIDDEGYIDNVKLANDLQKAMEE